MMGVPSSGTISEGTAQATFLASLDHEVYRVPSFLSGPNFNNLLCIALNAAAQGKIDVLLTAHADLSVIVETPNKRWGDILYDEADEYGADFISVPNTIKDPRGVASCGVGDPANRWNPWRRWTAKDFKRRLPRTFNAEMIGYGKTGVGENKDKFLLHNNACCLFDLRKPVWFQTEERNGRQVSRMVFNFTEEIFLDTDGVWKRDQESEDWAFSRDMWKAGVNSFLTSAVKLHHHGGLDYDNYGENYLYQDGDQDTQANWRASDPLPVEEQEAYPDPERNAESIELPSDVELVEV